MPSNFLETFAPYFASQVLAGSLPDAAPDIQTTPIQTQPSMPDPRSIPAPEMRQKRSVGNVLSDFFSGSRLASNMRDPGHAAWSDLLSNIARASRGEDPTHAAMEYARVLQAQDQQKAEYDRSQQARNAFAQLLLDPSAQNEAALGQLDPEQLLGYRKVQTDAEQQAAQQAHQERVDAFNAGRPVPLGGNGGYALYDADNGWQIHEGQPPLQRFETGNGQAGVIDPRTGSFKPIGGPKIPARRTQVVDVQTPNGPMRQLIDLDTGRPINTIGSAVPKGKTDSGSKASGAQALELLQNIESGFGDLHKMGALAGEGTPLGALGRTGIGQSIGEQLGSPAAQKRLELAKNISNLQQEMLKSLPASATRTKFEQEMIQRGLPDPMKMSYSTAQTVIRQLRESYKRALAEAGSSSSAAPSGNAAAIAEARRRGLIK